MLRLLILLLPCFFFTNWASLLIRRKGKSYSLRCLTAVSILGAVTFFGDAATVGHVANYKEAAVMETVMQSSFFLLFAFFYAYLKSLHNERISPTAKVFFLVPPVVLTAIMIWIWSKAGLGGMADYLKAYDLYRGDPPGYPDIHYRLLGAVTRDIDNLIIGIWILIEWGEMLRVLFKDGVYRERIKAFFAGKRGGSQSHVICFLAIIFFLVCILRLLLDRYYLADHPFLQGFLYLLTALLITNILYIGYWFDGKEVTLPSPKGGQNNQETAENDPLDARLKEYIETGEAFRDPGLSLESASEALSTNRTYLSKAVNRISGTNFRGYIGNLRIKTVKEEMLKHPGDRLDEIASRTGFASASQLVKKFRESTGQTPREWAKKQQ